MAAIAELVDAVESAALAGDTEAESREVFWIPKLSEASRERIRGGWHHASMGWDPLHRALALAQRGQHTPEENPSGIENGNRRSTSTGK